jgi:hypothetical protein
VVWVARTAEAHLSGGGAFVERAAAQAVPLMGLPLVPMTVSWPADTKLFVRGTTRDREASFRPLRRRRPSPTKRSLIAELSAFGRVGQVASQGMPMHAPSPSMTSPCGLVAGTPKAPVAMSRMAQGNSAVPQSRGVTYVTGSRTCLFWGLA